MPCCRVGEWTTRDAEHDAGWLGRFPSGHRVGRSYGRAIADEPPRVLLAVRHVGPRRARRLIDALGVDWRWAVELAPERVFGTVRGIGPRQAREAAESWRTVADAGGSNDSRQSLR